MAFIRIEFRTDRGGSKSTGDGRFDLSGPNPALPPVDRPPHNREFFLAHAEAARRYFDAQSYGRVVIEGDVWPPSENGAYSVSDMADFGPWKFSQKIYRTAVYMFRTMMLAADSESIALGDRIPWDHYDRFVIVHAGSDLQDDIKLDSPEDIPTFTIGTADSDRVIFPDSTTRPIDRCAFVPERIDQDGEYGAINGAIAHEGCIDIFGLDDVYNVEEGIPAVGLWDIMDSGNLAGAIVKLDDGTEIFATGFLPTNIGPFQRQFVGDALSFPEITDGDTITVVNSERRPDVRRMTLSTDEYLLLENRYQAPADSFSVDQDSSTTVVLGTKTPDRYEYDALAPGSGMLVWHIDESVIPFTTSLRTNPDFGINTDPARLGISIIEADGLADIGDPGSPYILGSYRDPYYVGNNTVLSDTTLPNLIPHIHTRPHRRLDVLDSPGRSMRVVASRAWALPGWPLGIVSGFPPGGPQLLAVDADGDGKLEVCWAGADTTSSDTTAIFALRADGRPIGSSPVIASLDRRPRPEMAALPIGGPNPEQGPALFAVTTYADGPLPTDAGGQAWLLDHSGFTYGPNWPASLPAKVTTPPVFVGHFPNAVVLVGCANGRLYALGLDGSIHDSSDTPLAGGVVGRLAACEMNGIETVSGAQVSGWAVAAAGANGDVAVFARSASGGAPGLTRAAGWPQRLSQRAGFTPDFLWLDFDGAGSAAGNPSGCGAGQSELVTHDADRLWAFCAGGRLLPGWGRSIGDTIAAGLGAGDADGDGFPEVLVQTYGSKISFVNLSGAPTPGWPKPGSPEGVLLDDTLLTGDRVIHRFPSLSPPLLLDVDGSGRPTVVALNTSGIIAALRSDGTTPAGWPLSTGSGVSGAPLAADLNHDGGLEIIAPDRFGDLFGYSLPAQNVSERVTSWTMVGGDPERTSSLPPARTSVAPAPSRGPLVAGSFKVFPNPARRHPVSIAYTLTEPARVEFRILDASGHQVASFARDGRMSENLETWEPGAVPAGLYMLQIHVRSRDSDETETTLVGLLK